MSLGAVRLRRGEPADALCLSVLAMQVFLDTYATSGIRPALAREVLGTYSVARFEAALAGPASPIEVAELDGHLVGFAQLTLGAGHALAPAVDAPGAVAELLRLYVQEPFTGSGLGTRLLARAEQVAAEAGAMVLWLTPWVHNHRALSFYARRGYTDHGLTSFHFEGETHDNRLFAKRLRLRAGAQAAPAGRM
jgi:GNAT superfamily N-acetyltransferase